MLHKYRDSNGDYRKICIKIWLILPEECASMCLQRNLTKLMRGGNHMKKKLLAVLLTAAMAAASMTGCGGQGASNSNASGSSTSGGAAANGGVLQM